MKREALEKASLFLPPVLGFPDLLNDSGTSRW